MNKYYLLNQEITCLGVESRLYNAIQSFTHLILEIYNYKIYGRTEYNLKALQATLAESRIVLEQLKIIFDKKDSIKPVETIDIRFIYRTAIFDDNLIDKLVPIILRLILILCNYTSCEDTKPPIKAILISIEKTQTALEQLKIKFSKNGSLKPFELNVLKQINYRIGEFENSENIKDAVNQND